MLVPIRHGRDPVQCLPSSTGHEWEGSAESYPNGHSHPIPKPDGEDAHQPLVSLAMTFNRMRPCLLTNSVLGLRSAWLHSEMPVGGGQKALIEFDQSLKNSYKLGMHGVMWEFFRAMYLMPGPLLKRYTTWGEVNIPPVLLSSVPGTLGQVSVLGLEALQSFPILSLGCSMGTCVINQVGNDELT